MSDTTQDNRPRGKGSKGPYRATEPDAPIPEYIRLPDGREFKTRDLVKKQNGTRNHTLTRKPEVEVYKTATLPMAKRTPKYTLEDRRWQAIADSRDIAKKYNVSLQSARIMKSQARRLLTTESTDTGFIIDHTKKT